jgi:hypothetical protein
MTAKKNTRARHTAQIDYVYVSFIVLLTVFGFLMLSSASSDIGARMFGDSAYFVKKQFMHFIIFGISGFFAALFVPYQWLKRAAVPFFIFSLALLSLVFIPGFSVSAKGAARWIDVGGFDESEIMRLGWEDREFWLRCLGCGYESVVGTYIGLLWRRHNSTMSDTSANPNAKILQDYIYSKNKHLITDQ